MRRSATEPQVRHAGTRRRSSRTPEKGKPRPVSRPGGGIAQDAAQAAQGPDLRVWPGFAAVRSSDLGSSLAASLDEHLLGCALCSSAEDACSEGERLMRLELFGAEEET